MTRATIVHHHAVLRYVSFYNEQNRVSCDICDVFVYFACRNLVAQFACVVCKYGISIFDHKPVIALSKLYFKLISKIIPIDLC